MYKALYCVLAIVIGATIGFLLCEPATPLLRMMEEAVAPSTSPVPERMGLVGVGHNGREYCTGFVIRVEESGSFVLTCNHCVDDPGVLQVYPWADREQDRVRYDAVILAQDYNGDTAVLFVPDYHAPYTFTLSNDALHYRDPLRILTVRPFGLACLTGTAGVFRSEQPIWRPAPLFSISVGVFGGCSGGPVLNTKGEVVGITSWDFGVNSLSGAVHISVAQTLLRNL